MPARIIDQMLRGHFTVFAESDHELAFRVQEAAARATNIVVDEVAAFSRAYVKDHHSSMLFAGTANVAPPFQEMIFEFDYPKMSGRMAMLTDVMEWEDVGDEERQAIIGDASIEEEPRWVLNLYPFLRPGGVADPVGPLSRACMLVSEMGSLILLDGKRPFRFVDLMAGAIDGMEDKDILDEDGADTLQNMLLGVLIYGCDVTATALTFMNCNNVELLKADVPAKVRRARLKKGKLHAEYHVLDIKPMTKRLQTEGDIDNVGYGKALHACRGHFKVFGKDGRGKLFGKVAGTFWWGSQLRGDQSAGRINKSYRVRT